MKARNKKALPCRTTDVERKARISNGTWMGRGAVFRSGKQYDRKRSKQETRKEEAEP